MIVVASRQLHHAQGHDQFDPQSPVYSRFNRLIHEAMLERERRLSIRFDGARFALNPRFADLNAATEVNRGSPVTFRGLIERYERSKQVRQQKASPKTVLKWAAQKRLFLELAGADTLIAQITRDKARAVFEAISCLPSNATKRFRCASPVRALGAALVGREGAVIPVSFRVGNYAAIRASGAGASDGAATAGDAGSGAFVWGAPFFVGRRVVLVLEGRGLPGRPDVLGPLYGIADRAGR